MTTQLTVAEIRAKQLERLKQVLNSPLHNLGDLSCALHSIELVEQQDKRRPRKGNQPKKLLGELLNSFLVDEVNPALRLIADQSTNKQPNNDVLAQKWSQRRALQGSANVEDLAFQILRRMGALHLIVTPKHQEEVDMLAITLRAIVQIYPVTRESVLTECLALTQSFQAINHDKVKINTLERVVRNLLACEAWLKFHREVNRGILEAPVHLGVGPVRAFRASWKSAREAALAATQRACGLE